MHGLESRPVPYELRGELLRVPLRVQPLFWLSAALLGVRYLSDPEAGSLGYFAFWMVSVLLSLLLRGLGQACVGKLFRMRGEILFDGLGSHIQGLESLPRPWQRVLVLLSGPLVQFLLVAGVLGFMAVVPYPEWLTSENSKETIATAARIVLQLNLVWGLLTLLPIWPLDGGRAAVAIGEAILGSRGRTFVLVLSLLTIASLSILVVRDMSLYLKLRYDPRYLLHLTEGNIRLIFCFVLWLGTFRAVWPETKL